MGKGLLFLFLLLTVLILFSNVGLVSCAQSEGSKTSGEGAGGASLSEVHGVPSLSPAFVDQVLAAYHSPAAGLGQVVYDLSLKYGVDNAFALAFFGHESTFGTAGAARVTRSWGNIICTPGWSSCVGRFRSYPTWQAGLEDYLLLLTREYFPRGLTTLETIIPVYAPASDGNSESGYIRAVQSFVSAWRAGRAMVEGV